MMQTTIIIPCYNEADRLDTDAYVDYVSHNKDVQFLFVNDGSKDDTLGMLKSLAESHAQIEYLDVQPNGGKAEAVRRGMLYAAEHFSSDFFAFYDADMATPLDDLLKMIKVLSDNELKMVTGCRFKRMGGDVQRSYLRFFMGRIFATFAAHVLYLPVYDTQCGAKVFSREIIPTLFEESFVSKWLFDIELFARIVLKYGYEAALTSIIEYPLSKWTEVGGSKLKLKDVLRQPINLINIDKHYKIRRYVKSTRN